MTAVRNLTSALLATCLLIALAAAQCPNDPNCSFCMGSQCVGCNGAVLSNGVCQQPNQSVSGCLSYATNGTCIGCSVGFYVVNNVCTPNPVSGCAIYTLTGGCTSCFNNVRALTNHCNGTGFNGTCNTANCEICSSAGVCQGCGRGYVFESTNSTCMAYRAGYYGCLRTTAGVCTACRYGFYYRNGGCTGSSLIPGTNFSSALNTTSSAHRFLGIVAAALLAFLMN